MSFPKRYTGPGWANLAPSSDTCKAVYVWGVVVGSTRYYLCLFLTLPPP